MENKRTVSQVFNNNPQGSRPRGRPRNSAGIVYKQTLRSVKLTTGKKGKKTELTGKGPLRRRRSALECSATE
jgi:hypothetical protein